MTNFRAIVEDDSANGFSGWTEFEAENEEDARAHAENILGTFKFTLKNLDEND